MPLAQTPSNAGNHARGVRVRARRLRVQLGLLRATRVALPLPRRQRGGSDLHRFTEGESLNRLNTQFPLNPKMEVNNVVQTDTGHAMPHPLSCSFRSSFPCSVPGNGSGTTTRSTRRLWLMENFSA